MDKNRHHSGPPPYQHWTRTSDLANVQRQPTSWSKQGCIAQAKFQNIGWAMGKNKLLSIEDWGVESTMACCLVFAHWASLNCHSSTLKHIVEVVEKRIPGCSVESLEDSGGRSEGPWPGVPGGGGAKKRGIKPDGGHVADLPLFHDRCSRPALPALRLSTRPC